MIGAEIADAFNANVGKSTWSARARASEGSELVHFTTSAGLVNLTYDVRAGTFQVAFNRFHGTWGDYVKATARALQTVLAALKAGGLPFEAPASPDGIEIVITATETPTTYVRWPGQIPPIMPELAERVRAL